MFDTSSDELDLEYRLVLIDGPSMRVMAKSTRGGPILPRESVPAFARTAYALTEAIYQRYGLRTIQLAILPEPEDAGFCAVHEILGPAQVTSGRLSFLMLDEISSLELPDKERALVVKIIRAENSELGRFARLGWITELMTSIGSCPYWDVWPSIRHLNQGVNFCLLSLSLTDGSKIWFKAVGEPNTREYSITSELTRRFPEFLPKMIFTLPEWNGWVMEDVQGTPLNESIDVQCCHQALLALSIMQMEMAGHMDSMMRLGAKDWSCARLTSLSAPFFAEAQEAMRAQTSTKALPLSFRELAQLQGNIELMLREITDAGIVDTLVHGDIGHGNVIATSRGPVFLDWAETYLGHPFLSAEHLLADLVRSNSHFAAAQAHLRSFYAGLWKARVSTTNLEKTCAHAPAIAAFAYGLIAWDACRDRPNPRQAWPLLRSMLRKTKYELEQSAGMMA